VEAPDFTKKPQSLTKTARLINFILRWLMPLALRVKGVDFKVEGIKNIPKKGPIVIIGTPHLSLADAFFMIASIRRPYVAVGMAELLSDEWPWIIRKGFGWLGHIPIVRGNGESGDLVSRCAIHALEWSQALMVWPDGRQVRSGDEVVWYPGFAKFAKATGAKVYIFKIHGVDKFWDTHPDNGNASVGDINWNAPVRATFSGPIDPNDYDTVEHLIEATKHIHNELSLPK